MKIDYCCFCGEDGTLRCYWVYRGRVGAPILLHEECADWYAATLIRGYRLTPDSDPSPVSDPGPRRAPRGF